MRPYLPSGGVNSTVGIDLTPLSSRTGGAATQIRAIGDGTSNAHLSFWTTSGAGNSSAVEKMRILDNGLVGIGTTNPTRTLHVNGDLKLTAPRMTFTQEGFWNGIRMETGSPDNSTRLYLVRLNDGVGVEVYAASFNPTSSIRYKTNIESYTKGLNELLQLNPVYYKLINDNIKRAGFIAEDIDDIGLKEHISYNTDGLPESLNYNSLITICVNAIKEQQLQINQLKEQLSLIIERFR